ncbi:hypothetical protein [Sphingobium aromaticiconvertens]|uniref:hypothetical protein n=1 Tax=Sphingobium aromaticiconvertens TaxID=365341 RepID=UPI0030188270
MSDTPAPRSLIERLARHLATRQDVDWSACVEDAASILAILKDPDPAMSEAGNAATWRAMVDAALTERWTIGAPLSATSTPLPAGSDEEGESALSPEQVNQSAREHAAWVHINSSKGD